MKVAFYDIGTNSIHMKIVEFHKDLSFEVLEHKKDMTRIGDGSFKSKKLSKNAVKRALRVLSRYSALAKEEGVKKHIAMATSAVRDAKNGDAFAKALLKKTGIRVKVISGEEEGRLIYLGACSNRDDAAKRILSVDIGGGSAEFTLGSRSKIDFSKSLPLGVARLKDRFIHGYPPKKNDLRNLREQVAERLEEVLALGKNKTFNIIVGTGGTLVNLAAMDYENRTKRRLRLRGYYVLDRANLKKLCKRLCSSGLKRVGKFPGLDKKRADIIVGGAVLVAELMNLFKAKQIHISGKGIREGMILDYLTKHYYKSGSAKPRLNVQWFGQKPFISGIVRRNA